MIQFQNDFVLVELDHNPAAIVLIWKGYIPSAVYREALEKALDIAREHQITNWISDIRQMKILEAEDREWASNVWLQNAVSANCYKKQAVIMAKDIFGGAAARYLITAALDQQVEVQNFTSLEEAKEWLRTDDDKNSY